MNARESSEYVEPGDELSLTTAYAQHYGMSMHTARAQVARDREKSGAKELRTKLSAEKWRAK